MEGKGKQTIVMTGGTSGLGFEAAIDIASEGAHLIALCRNPKKGDRLKTEFAKRNNGGGSIHIIPGDLNSFESVKNACDAIKDHVTHIDRLILNAGVMNFWFRKTKDGIEETLQVNLLSHLLMTELLLPLVPDNKGAKVIFTTSALHQGTINFDNLEFKKGFSSFKVYRQSKLGVNLCTRLLAKKLKDRGITVVCQHPGMVRTNLGRSAGIFSKLVFLAMGTSIEKGAENLIFLSKSKASDLSSGEYYAYKKVRKITEESYDMEMAAKLYERCSGYIEQYLDQ